VTAQASNVGALQQIDSWPVLNAVAGVLWPDGTTTTHGDADRPFALASITKLLTAWAVLIAVEETIVDLDQPVGQPGCTLRHLLSHAGGYPFNGDAPIAVPQKRRIYSNTGIELAAALVAEQAAMPFERYLADAVLGPLGMSSTRLDGSPAWAAWGTVNDLLRFAAEVLRPRLIDPSTASVAYTVQFPGLSGLVPGVGRYADCQWGAGFEIKDGKTNHWMGATNSAEAFGHFGGSGTFMWMERGEPAALIALTDRRFEDWSADALRLWPAFSDAVLAEIRLTRATAGATP